MDGTEGVEEEEGVEGVEEQGMCHVWKMLTNEKENKEKSKRGCAIYSINACYNHKPETKKSRKVFGPGFFLDASPLLYEGLSVRPSFTCHHCQKWAIFRFPSCNQSHCRYFHCC